MKRACIYLQNGFWKDIKKLHEELFGPNGWDLFCVFRRSRLYAEIPIEDFMQDDWLSILWHESGGSCYVDKGHVEAIIKGEKKSIEDFCSVFLLDKDNATCKKYANKNGNLCLNSEILSKHHFLTTIKPIPFDFHEKGSYYDLKKYFFHPCNSLLLIDPHILKEKTYIKYHIKPLLDNILPDLLDIPFHISIFSGIGKINEANDGESYYDGILKMLQEIRPKLVVSLTLYQIPIQGEGWHARYLVTNNLMINAPDGFDFFGPIHGELKAKKVGKFVVSCPWLEKNNDIKE